MSKVIVDMGVSLDRFIAGPIGGPHNALGDGASDPSVDVPRQRGSERQSLAGGQIKQDDEVDKEVFHLSKRTAYE